jgi:glycosyltransferase involved in cell wall biosynthesis
MRILIDGTPLLLRSAGVKTHVHNWIQSLRQIASACKVDVFPMLNSFTRFSHERSVVSFPGTLWRLSFLQLANYTGLDAVRLLHQQPDVFHVSHQFWSPPHHVRITTTIYDMTCWVVPETHPFYNVKGAKRFAQRVITRVDGLIANSQSAKQDAIRILGLPEDKIEVIHPGVAEAYFRAYMADSRARVKKYGLLKPYIFFVGAIEPRKNLDMLLDAYQQLPGSLRDEFDLVLAGPAGWATPKTLVRIRRGPPGVRYLGYVAEQDLPELTAGASIFVYPSLYEGFGLPVAQAMAAGAPVITSNVSSLPEVCGDAALLIDPRSATELRDAIAKLLLSPTMQEALRKRGHERARLFTWERYAQKSLDFFRTVCGRV